MGHEHMTIYGHCDNNQPSGVYYNFFLQNGTILFSWMLERNRRCVYYHHNNNKNVIQINNIKPHLLFNVDEPIDIRSYNKYNRRAHVYVLVYIIYECI